MRSVTRRLQRVILSIGAICLCSTAVTSGQDALGAGASAKAAAKGADLMAEARKALGGEERLRAVKTLDVRGDFKRAAGQNTLEGDLQLRLELPDKLRRDEDTSLPGGGPAIIRTEVLNGHDVWDEGTTGQGVRAAFGDRFGRGGGGGGRGGGDRQAAADGSGRATIDPAQLEEALRRARQADLSRLKLVWLLTTDAPVTWIGTAESPDGKADVVEITPENQPAMRLFLDQTSHLPLMITWQGAAPQLAAGRPGRADQGGAGRGRGAPQATLQMTLADYKVVNGIRFPHLITRGTSEQTTEEWTIESYRINPSFRSNVFTR